jgi:hypothetical protein
LYNSAESSTRHFLMISSFALIYQPARSEKNVFFTTILK